MAGEEQEKVTCRPARVNLPVGESKPRRIPTEECGFTERQSVGRRHESGAVYQSFQRVSSSGLSHPWNMCPILCPIRLRNPFRLIGT